MVACRIYLARYETPGRVCKIDVFEWYKMSGGLAMWQMYVISFAFGQCEHVNSTMY